MKLNISERELLAGTEAIRRIHPEGLDARVDNLRQLRCANATMGGVDIGYIVTMYGDVLSAAVSQAKWHDLLERCATPIDREEFSLWLAQCTCVKTRVVLFGMFNDGVVILYSQVHPGHLLAADINQPQVGRWDYFVYPADKSSDHLADDEETDSGRLRDFADDGVILSAICAEWMQGRTKSAAARDFICTVCEEAEGIIQ